MEFQQRLSQFDLTSIIVGAIVGADIYIASAITAGLVGPFSIVLWVVAGVFATTIAMVFAYCSYYVPRVGGPFAYVSEAFDDFYGFSPAGACGSPNSLHSRSFAIAFANYLQALIPLTPDRRGRCESALHRLPDTRQHRWRPGRGEIERCPHPH